MAFKKERNGEQNKVPSIKYILNVIEGLYVIEGSLESDSTEITDGSINFNQNVPKEIKYITKGARFKKNPTPTGCKWSIVDGRTLKSEKDCEIVPINEENKEIF